MLSINSSKACKQILMSENTALPVELLCLAMRIHPHAEGEAQVSRFHMAAGPKTVCVK